jgi:hypothetical protein
MNDQVCSVGELIEIAMERNNDNMGRMECIAADGVDYRDLRAVGDFLQTPVYTMDKATPHVAFTLWTEDYVYFPLVNDMGVKWVSSVCRNPANVPVLLEC